MEIIDWLGEACHLRVKHPAARIVWTGGVLHALGLRITRTLVQPLARSRRRLGATIGRALREDAEPADIEASVSGRISLLLR